MSPEATRQEIYPGLHLRLAADERRRLGGQVVLGSEAELPRYQKYGVSVIAPTGLYDGAAIAASLETPDGSL